MSTQVAAWLGDAPVARKARPRPGDESNGAENFDRI